MKPDQPLHLTGELRIGRRFLELHAGDGAIWELSTTLMAHRHIGRQVEVIGASTICCVTKSGRSVGLAPRRDTLRSYPELSCWSSLSAYAAR